MKITSINTLLIFAALFVKILGATNYVLDFDGTDDYVSVPAINLNNDIITIEAWLKPADSMTRNYVGIIKTRDGSSVAGLYLHSNGDIRYNWNNDSNAWTHDFGTSVRLVQNNWDHIALVINDTQVELYKNGVASGNPHSYNHSNEAWDGETKIGVDGTTPNRYFDGQIDEVRIWSDVRTQTEIQDNMNQELTGSESNLVAYYKMSDGSGTSLTDNSSNSYTGTLTNKEDYF